MMKYEFKAIETDPFDIMCGECQEHEIEYWKESSLEELHEMHEAQLMVDKWVTEGDKQQYEDMTGEKWVPTTANFDEWLKAEIQNGNIRVTEESEEE